MSIASVMPSNHIILCRPLLLLPSIFPSIRVFSNKSALCIRWLKYWSFSFNISPSNEYSQLISFRKDWLDLLAVQGTLKSLLQHHSSKASILWRSAFFIVQLSHPYMTTGKTIALTRRTFVGKIMSLLLNTLSRLVITFLPRSIYRIELLAELNELTYTKCFVCFSCDSDGKDLPAMQETGSIPGSETSPREGNGNPLQYSCLENLMDIGGWWATDHGVAKSRTRVRD